MEGHLQGAEVMILPPASISAAGTISTVSQGVLGAQRTAVFALFPFLMQAYGHLYAKSILRVFRNTQQAKLERK